ncbi:MAG: acyl-CoA dehydrogenase family protein [Halobacteriales archaeon]
MNYDYLDLESDLPEEERRARDTAREFVDDRVKPDVADWYRDGVLPREILSEMGDLGFYLPTAEDYGLPGLSYLAYGLVLKELEAGDSGVRSAASVQGSLVMYPIHEFGSESQRERLLPALGTGDLIGCFGLTEPGHGSDPASMETTATPVDGGYLLDGRKTWITNAPIADVALVWARDVERDTVRGYLVDTDLDGVETPELDGKLSMRASSTGEIHLDDVEVTEEDVLPGVDGMRGPLSCLTMGRYGVAWGVVGAMRDCLESAVEYACDREQWGRPIAGFQMQHEKIAEMATKTSTASLLVHRLAELAEEDRMKPQQVSMAKRHNAGAARYVARTAREMLGGNGITLDYPPMRHLANVETVYTYEGTHDVHSLILGADITGIDAFEG